MKAKSTTLIILLLLSFSSDSKSSTALDKMLSILQSSEDIQALWPGFITSFHHAIYEDNGDIFLAYDSNRLEGWEPISTIHSVSIFKSNDPSLKNDPGFFFIDKTVSNDLKINGAKNNKYAIATLFHESFHSFQESLNRPDIHWKDVKIKNTHIELKKIEFSLLQKLINSIDKPEQFNTLATKYTSLRTYRESSMDPKSVELERSLEWSEGVANYVGFRAQSITNNQSSFHTDLVEYGIMIDKTQTRNELQKFMRMDAYFYGAAICTALDKSKPDWKSLINQGQTPFELMLSIFPAKPLNAEEIDNLLGSDKNSEKEITQNVFAEHLNWKAALRLNKTADENAYFSALEVSSFDNGFLADKIISFNIKSQLATVSGKTDTLFIERSPNQEGNQVYIKTKKSLKLSKKCQSLADNQWLCKKGTQLKSAKVKVKFLQDTKVNLERGLLDFVEI